MRQEETRSEKHTHQRSLNSALVEKQPAGSWVVAPTQMHDLLTAYWTSCRRTTGELDLAIEIAEDLGPMPCDYSILILQIIDECVRYIGCQINGTPSVQVRLSEARRNARLGYVVLEVANRGPAFPKPRVLSEGLLRLRSRTEEWNGFLVIDGSCEDETMFRAALPIVLISH